ncbi:hypothetical protein ACJMK2_006738 [Sinanodonta woodiana]|uniref:Sulfatase N-terminal domain-containing protein n=1 Tax=Sinanodonta woodiana TaxID=1069815 RepID=A0ABD3VU24_SINWO
MHEYASVCTPSRAALLTGRYGIRSGMVPIGIVRVNLFAASTCGLPPSEVTLAELAKQVGYNTAAIGKWHLGLHEERYGDFKTHPLNQGFDRFYGFPGTNMKDFGDEGDRVILDLRPTWYAQLITLWLCVVIPLACMYKAKFASLPFVIAVSLVWSIPFVTVYWTLENFKTLNSMLYRDREIVEQPIRLPGLTHRLVEESVEFMEESAKEEKPFLLYLAWSHTHTFLATAREFEGKSKHGRYGDAVEELDWGVGRILEALDRLNIKNNTLVYFTSDNGGHLEEKGLNGEVDGGCNGILLGFKTYKLVYKMPDYLPGTNQCIFVCGCHSARVLEKPLLFDVTSDPGERSPLPSSYPGYSDIIEAINKAVATHKSSIVPVESQFTARKLIWRPHWQDCCNFPKCSCSDPKYA